MNFLKRLSSSLPRAPIGLFIVLFVLAIQLIALPQTGMTWDEPASFFIGRANLKFWMTGNRAYLNDTQNKQLFADSPFWFVWGEELYPPFPFLVSSAVSFLIAEKVKLLSVIDAHHLAEVLIGVAGVAALWGISRQLGLTIVGTVGTTLAYSLYPTIIGQMRSDAKDVPLVSILMIAVYCFIRWIKAWSTKDHRKTWEWGAAWAVAFGLAQATKPTAVIMAPILAAWILSGFMISKQFRTGRLTIAFFCGLFVFGIVAVGVFFAVWPWLWDDPVGKLTQVWGFFRVVGRGMPQLYLGTIYWAGVNMPKIYPFGILFFQTPIELTILAIIGFAASIVRYFRKKDVFAILPVLWFGLAMARFFLPGVVIYARVRHFIDAMPAFFLLVGFGIQAVVWVSSKVVRKMTSTVATALIALIVFHQLWVFATFVPHEPSYYNFLVGGTKTVSQKGLFDVDNWAGAVKDAMEYIASVNPSASVYTCQLRHLAIYYKTPTMRILATNPETADYVILPNSPSWFGWPLSFSRQHHTLVYTVSRGGGDIYYVFQNTTKTGMPCLGETLTTYEEQ